MTSVPNRRGHGENPHPRSRTPSRLPGPAHETRLPHLRGNRKSAHRPLRRGTNEPDPRGTSHKSRGASGVQPVTKRGFHSVPIPSHELSAIASPSPNRE